MYDARVLRVVFAEDNYLVREGTVALLQEVGNVDVVATAESYDGLLSAVASQAPDAVLTDIRMPPTFTTEGIDAAKRIRNGSSHVGDQERCRTKTHPAIARPSEKPAR